MMGYRVLTSADPMDLEEQVNEYIKKGWKLQGGVCVGGDGCSVGNVSILKPLYAQAMVIGQDTINISLVSNE